MLAVPRLCNLKGGGEPIPNMSLAHVWIAAVFLAQRDVSVLELPPGAACKWWLIAPDTVTLSPLLHKGFGCVVHGSMVQKARSWTQHGVQGIDQPGRGGRSTRRLTEKGWVPSQLLCLSPWIQPEANCISSSAKSGNLVHSATSALQHNYPEHLEANSLDSKMSLPLRCYYQQALRQFHTKSTQYYT